MFNFPIKEVFDFSVLEYSFAIWQWGKQLKNIPSIEATDQEYFDHLMKASDVDYLSHATLARIKSFFVQAAHELGYYGYDTKPFKKYLSIKTAKNYLNKKFIPDLKIKYNKKTMKRVNAFLQKTDKNMIWIYGGDDPWTAPAVVLPQKDNFLKIVKEGGYHRTRINNLPDDQKQQIFDKLEKWLGITISNN